MKKTLIFLGIFVSTFMISCRVSAMTEEEAKNIDLVQTINEYKKQNPDIDFEKYSNVFAVSYYYGNASYASNYFYIIFYDSSDSLLYKSPYIYSTNGKDTTLRYSAIIDKEKNFDSYSLFDDLGVTFHSTSTIHQYYSNRDVLDKNGNIVFAKNSDDIVDYQYVFDDVVYGTKYSKVELEFDIKGNIEQILDFNYDFHLVQPSGNLDELNIFNSPYFVENSVFCSENSCSVSKDRYFRILKDKPIFGSSEIDAEYVYDEFFDSNEKSTNSNSYIVDSYNIVINNDSLTKVTSSIKFVIDLTFDSSLIVDSYFQSSIPFTVNYYERNVETPEDNYYSIVDLTNKYGVMFIPKLDTSVSNLNIRTLFNSVGHLDIQHRSSYDPEDYEILSAYSMNYCNNYLLTQEEIPYSCNNYNGSFEFYITNDKLYQSLFFVNTVYNNDLTSSVNITYDSRYYIYYIFDTPDSVIEGVNPNTGEDFSLSLKDFFNYVPVRDNVSIKFNTFLKPINFIFSSITNFYNEYCIPDVQNFLYISFTLFIVLSIIKIIF